ncbi:MAG: hypothetical protein ACR2IH_00585 [Pyrinomonadaceae bacterium]
MARIRKLDHKLDLQFGVRTLLTSRFAVILELMLRNYYGSVTRVRDDVWVFLLAVLLLFASANTGFAQSLIRAGSGARSEHPSGFSLPTNRFRGPARAEAADRAARIKRWFEFDEFAVSSRYRFIDNAGGTTVSNALQYRVAGRGRFKLDRGGKYSIVAGLYSGNTFTGGWNATGLGTGSVQTNLYLKQLYLDARPVKSVEIQFGGIGINNGDNTEATGYDNDAYITGERIIIRRPKAFYFDEISLTNAHLGDLNHPSIFRRLDNFAKSNYHQLLVRKQVNKRVGFSADYTFVSGSDTFREAVKVKTPETHFVDLVVFENYQRFDGPGRYGFNLFGERKFGKKLTLDGGFAHIDASSLLNGDRYTRGNQIHATGTYHLNPEFSIASFIDRHIGPEFPNLPRTRFELIFGYNLLELLRRHNLQ